MSEEKQTVLAALAEGLTEEQLEAMLTAKRSKRTKDREAYKELVAEALPVQARLLIELSAQLSQAKRQVFETFETIIATKTEVFGVKNDKSLKTHTFSDDNYRLTIGYREIEDWDDSVTAGIKKIMDFINSLGVDKKTGVLVDAVINLLRKDKKGNLRASSVLTMRKMQKSFESRDFDDGVAIISDAYKPKQSCWFVEVEKKDESGAWVAAPLSMAGAKFPEDYTFKGF